MSAARCPLLRIAACSLLLATCHGMPALADTLDQIPKLKSLPDSTDALQAKIDRSNGNLLLGDAADRGVLRITKPLVFDLTKHHAVSVRAAGGLTIVMDGAGPALRFVGSHQGTASPKTFKPQTWNERMPIVSGIEILGNHPKADGIELVQTVGPIISHVSVRWCRHGVHLVNRNRNVVISDCHFYENSGVGVYLDDVNLHQINVSNSHVSYNRQGGIVVRDGNVRNLQVSGCDIEANMPADETSTRTANILIDVSASPDTRSKSVAEVSITGCTIQHSANYGGSSDKTVAPGGANIRLAGKEVYPIDSVTISGNVLSDTTVNIDIAHARDVAISANNFFAPKPANLHVKNSKRVVLTGNTFNPRQFARPGTMRFDDCADCIVAACSLHKFTTGKGALILDHCDGFVLNGLNLTDCGSGIVLKQTRNTTLSSCRVARTTAESPDISIDDSNSGIRLMGNAFDGRTEIDAEAVEPPQ
ncbi:MAG: right-handed parallel beta-helix repeat-containing protein [Planctomycetota bacterium]